MRFNWRIGIALSVAAVAVTTSYFVSTSDGPRQTAARYVKHEYRIPMRDGVKLFTQVYVPRDGSRTYPFLVQRTPFGVQPYREDRYRPQLGASSEFDRAGYIFVFQDVRGRFQSEGEFVDMRPHVDQPKAAQTDESTDMYDTVEWLLAQTPSNNGKVGVWGMSYQGFYAAASIIDSHPAIKAASIQAPMTNLFLGDDAYHNGAFMLAEQFQIYANYFKPRAGPEFPSPEIGRFFDYGTSDGYEFFLTRGPGADRVAKLVRNPLLDENIQHDSFDDYWKVRDISQHVHNIHCPVLNVGGWFDAEDLAGTFRTYHAIAERNPGVPTPLVMGPWGHGDWIRSEGRRLGPLDFGSQTAAFFRDQLFFGFFQRYLKDAPSPNLPGAMVFETGTNQWQRYETWPPANARPSSLYLHAHGKLTFEQPSKPEGSFDEYVSDPARPVPYLEHPSTELASEYMYGDQRFAAGRSDVLTYRTDSLDQDVAVAGPVTVRLYVSSSGTDADFDVKLIDEYPASGESPASGPAPGYQQLVRGEPMRARFSKSFSIPEALQPGKVTPIQFEMPDVNHAFLRGHRIMVQVQSSWFPLTDLNPQTFVRIPSAKPSDFVKATQHLWHVPEAASAVVLNILQK
jgi:putative CocE/NonD family hydrolase